MQEISYSDLLEPSYCSREPQQPLETEDGGGGGEEPGWGQAVGTPYSPRLLDGWLGAGKHRTFLTFPSYIVSIRYHDDGLVIKVCCLTELVYFSLFDDLCPLRRVCPLSLLSPEDGGEEPLAQLSPHGLPGAQSGSAVAHQVGAVQTEGEAAEDQPLQGEAATMLAQSDRKIER